ncbi:MAG: SusE domain-containing protein [Duncaniella sp.]|uniref:SusE domain-containing protein n=1 Tax=Duncaniella sp. TaxID=2518496 RepID=UPI0023BEEBBF|nr:SusE domain-containing protein [Duncaniella sp.]MDE6090500.1 SusE domain-containing protein [Duncaniella sp.]
MKKASIFLTLAAVSMLGFTSCEDDKEPVYQVPTEFHLNTPPLATQLYELTPSGTIEFTCSQPNYGYAATPVYSIDISLSEQFTTNTDGSTNFYTVSGNPKTSARIVVSDSEIAQAICELKGITGFAEYPEEGLESLPIYVRAYASLTGVESSGIYSNNVIKLDNVLAYNPYPEAGRTIYIVGGLTGWGVDTATPESFAQWGLQETGVGTNIYVGAFDVPAGDQYFRFYTTLGNWGNDGELPSIGPKPNDGDNEEVNPTDDPVTYTAVPGKGCWFTPSSWEGGYVTFTVDLNNMDAITVTMQKGNWDTSKLKFIYLVGACSAWSVEDANAEELYSNYKLYDWENNGVYTGTFQVNEGAATFRFYTQLGSWGNDGELPSIGAAAGDSNNDVTVDNGTYSGTCVEGKGNWNITNWTGGKMKMTVDMPNMKVKFEAVE